jgi:hypothetical protein
LEIFRKKKNEEVPPRTYLCNCNFFISQVPLWTLKQQTSSPAAAEAERTEDGEEKRGIEGRGVGREAQLSSILTSSVNIGDVTNNLSMKYQLSSEEVRRRKRRGMKKKKKR